MDQAMMIVELRARADATDDAIEKLDSRVNRHDEIIASLREAVAKVATKDDITELRKDINQTYAEQMRDAHNSIPTKIGLLIAAGSLLVTLLALFLPHHG
jgi:septal ring factor EnvC (AmiA/AmiB activator)